MLYKLAFPQPLNQFSPLFRNSDVDLTLATCPLPTQELVDELYNFRDCYFETHSVEEAERKDDDVKQKMEQTLKKLEEKEGASCISETKCS